MKLKKADRLARIAQIIEDVDNRAMATDGPVPPTLSIMTQSEISEIYNLARATQHTGISAGPVFNKPPKGDPS